MVLASVLVPVDVIVELKQRCEREQYGAAAASTRLLGAAPDGICLKTRPGCPIAQWLAATVYVARAALAEARRDLLERLVRTHESPQTWASALAIVRDRAM
jgi:hypothetical protein